jgi:predicted amidophosphoribosyltransferase
VSFLICPICTTKLKQACTNCKAPLEALWQVCPFCETPVEPVAVGEVGTLGTGTLGTRRAVRRPPA